MHKFSEISITYNYKDVKFDNKSLSIGFLESYATKKGLPIDFLVKNGINQHSPNRLNLPYFDENGHFLFNRRRYQKWIHKFLWDFGAKITPYGLWLLKDFSSDYILLVEGETDSLTCWLNGIQALGIPGCNTFQPSWATLLTRFKKIYFYVEDLAGLEASKKLFQFLPNLILVSHDGYHDSKLDVNDLYLNGVYLHEYLFNVKNQISNPSINNINNSFLPSNIHVCVQYSDYRDTEIKYSVTGWYRGLIKNCIEEMRLTTMEREKTFSMLAELIIFNGAILAIDYQSGLDRLYQVGLEVGLKSSQLKSMIKYVEKKVTEGKSKLNKPEIKGLALTRTWETYTPTPLDLEKLIIKPGRKKIDLTHVYSYLRNNVNRNPKSNRILGDELENGFLSFAGSLLKFANDLGVSVRTLKYHMSYLIEMGFMVKITKEINGKKFYCWRLGTIKNENEIYFINIGG